MLGSTFKCSVVEDGCKIAHLPGVQHCKALQNCSPWQPEVSKLQEFPRHCPSKAAKLQTWQSKSAKLQALQALVAKQTWQGFSSNTARLCKTATPTNLPKHCPSKGAKLQTWQGCKVPTLQGQLQHCKTFQASLLNCRALARLQNCQPARAPTLQGCKTTALANLANLPKFQHCRLPTCCKVCQTTNTNKAAKSKLQGSNTAGTPNCKASQACQAVC